MAGELLAADVIVQEDQPTAATPPSLPTAVAGFVGVTKRGPFGKRLINSWPEFLRIYGGYMAGSDLPQAVYGYFQNGGNQADISRVVHYTDPATPGTKQSAAASVNLTTTGAATQGNVSSGNAEPFALDPGDTAVLSVDGDPDETATFDAAAGSRTGVAGTFPTLFSGGETLQVKVDGGVVQTVTFAAGDQSLVDVLARINMGMIGGYADDDGSEVRLTSDRKGTGSYMEVVGGTAAATLGLAVGSTQGTGDVSNIAAVTALEIKIVIEADTTAEVVVNGDGTFTVRTPTVGAGGSIQIQAASTIDDAAKCDLDNAVHAGTPAGPGNTGSVAAKYDGAWGNAVLIRIAAATSGDAEEFNWYTLENGVVGEFWSNLSTDPTHPNYWEKVVNDPSTGSQLVDLTDLLTGVPPANRPANGDYTLTGGADGLTGLADTDFIGSEAGKTGMYALDDAEDLTLLAIPGRATAAVHQAMIVYCETHRQGQVFAILDSPTGMTAEQVRDYVRTTASLYDFSSFGAFFWPRIRVLNPDETLFTSDANGLVVVPPSGHIMGICARVDGTPGGVHQAPAGTERGRIFGCLGFETDECLLKAKRDVVYPSNINPLTTWSGAPRHVDGNRTLKTSGIFGTIGERRGMSYIERLIKLALAFCRHSNNTKALRRRSHRTVDNIMLGELRVGAFASDVAEQAYWIDFSDALNPPSVVNSKKLIGKVGVAKAKPVDWVIITISEDTAALDEATAG